MPQPPRQRPLRDRPKSPGLVNGTEHRRATFVHHLTAAEALAGLGSREEGLSAREAARRAVEFGPNEVTSPRRRSLVARLSATFLHFFALILWLAAALSFVAAWRDPSSGMATLGAAIVAVIVVNGAFSLWQETEAERALAELQRLLPHRARVRRDAVVQELERAAVVPGDVVLLAEGDDVPADCRVLSATGLRVETAALTGESAPVPRRAAPSTEPDAIRADNVLLAGTSVVSGEASAVVFATGMRTEFGRIAALTRSAATASSPLQREIARTSRLLAAFATLLGVAFVALGQALHLRAEDSLLFGIGVIVANVPEGLLPTVTLALAMAARRMARRNVLVRNLPAVETLGAATVICTDKTGTLTANRMVARQLWVHGRTLPATREGALAARAASPALLATAARCHELREVLREGTAHLAGDPLEVALRELAALADVAPDAERVDAVPFDPERKRASTLCRDGAALRVHCKGGVESVLSVTTRVSTPAGPRALTDADRRAITEAHDEMAASGLRVLAFAQRDAAPGEPGEALERELTFAGLIGLYDPPRPEVPDAIARCRAAGIRVIMTTGDHPRTAVAIARLVGLVGAATPAVLTGDAIRRLSETELQLALDAREVVCARLDPDHKLRIVAALRRKGEVVCVTGDGVNDAPALQHADVGVAMGRSGTDVAREAADLVLADDNFASIVAAIEEGRAVADNIRKFLTYILTSNVPELVPYLCFVLLRLPLALTVIQILAVDLGTDVLPALALGAERPRSDVMQRPPRPATARLLDGPLLARAYLWLGGLEAAGAMLVFAYVLHAGGWHRGAAVDPRGALYLSATGACLTTIVLMQVANLFSTRGETASALRTGLRGNRLLVLGVLVELAAVALIDYTRPGQALFGTRAVPASAWGLGALCALGLLALEEARKALVRARDRARAARSEVTARGPHAPHAVG